jgi:hypothetical protein
MWLVDQVDLATPLQRVVRQRCVWVSERVNCMSLRRQTEKAPTASDGDNLPSLLRPPLHRRGLCCESTVGITVVAVDYDHVCWTTPLGHDDPT